MSHSYVADMEAKHDRHCFMQAECDAYDNSLENGVELSDSEAHEAAATYLAEGMKTCECHTEENGWGYVEFVSYAEYNK